MQTEAATHVLPSHRGSLIVGIAVRYQNHLQRDCGHITGVLALTPIIWPSNRAVGHDNRQQQLDPGRLSREQRLRYVM